MAHARRGLAAVATACLLALLGSGCTPDTPPPAPPTTSSPTPTENAQELEERLAYEAAEKSYREFRVEFNRILALGGAMKATSELKRTAGGSYLKDNLEVLQAYSGLGYHQVGVDRIVNIRRSGFSRESVLLSACEDSSKTEIINRKDRRVGRGDVRELSLEVRSVEGSWKVWAGSGTKVDGCGE